MVRHRWVYCEINKSGLIIRIYKGLPPIAANYTMTSRERAVAEIRRQVFIRSKGDCEYCGKNLGQGGHMHETIHRSRGGQISLENCVAICAECHRGEHPGIGGGVA